ncbi:acetyl-CoA carboxylase biotin carboxylase subunit [Thermicanus aegyptius]|uniref:acetyl-CoA carboxylase biotin carboxylase subunit n=1 Tax=Thermicanus aegyptius TaxID=94009 RepID=UPI000400ECC9
MQIKKILVANRGEIARRILRTVKRMGIGGVAVYSDADRELPYVKEADEAVPLGEAPVAKSYLSWEKILDAARKTGADAIHPGYGFLSENAGFAQAVKKADIIWIGPEPEVIRLMGDKVSARRQMIKAGVPVVPGWDGESSDLGEILGHAHALGYPIMVKASAGGGGIGMQVVRREEELEEKLSMVRQKAQAYFGDGKVYLEKWVEKPRHVEVQVLADDKGNVLHLFERDCSIQRRHQKVIEETPAPMLSDEGRRLLYERAVACAKAVNYRGAGTVEFIQDGKDFYFLEMNTRLQVEHPITELVTGLDLVEWQIRIARGEALPFEQREISRFGHAIEFRIYAEDPSTFYPSPGKVSVYNPPQGEGIRVDDGIEEGSRVTPYYDPLLAKLAVWGKDREETLIRAEKALKEFRIEGIKQNIPLHLQVLNESRFRRGEYDTHFLEEWIRKKKEGRE